MVSDGWCWLKMVYHGLWWFITVYWWLMWVNNGLWWLLMVTGSPLADESHNLPDNHMDPACWRGKPKQHQPSRHPTLPTARRGLENCLQHQVQNGPRQHFRQPYPALLPKCPLVVCLVLTQLYQQTAVLCWHCQVTSTWHHAVSNPLPKVRPSFHIFKHRTESDIVGTRSS